MECKQKTNNEAETTVAVLRTNAKPARVFGRELHNKQASNFSPKSRKNRTREEGTEETRDRSMTALSLGRPTLRALEEYRAAIDQHLLAKDAANPIRRDYMNNQPDINSKMRSILVDWLVDVHLKFELLPQTLHVAISLLDRYLQSTKITRTQLQLTGIACLMIASKIEEVYVPMVKDYLSVCDNAYNNKELLAMEGEILAAVDFNVLCPTPFTFLSGFAMKTELEDKLFYYAQFLLETALLEMGPLKHGGAVLAAASLFLTNKLFKRGGLPEDLTSAVGISEDQAKAGAKELFLCLQKSEKGELRAVSRKFSEPQFLEVAKYQIQKGSQSKQ